MSPAWLACLSVALELQQYEQVLVWPAQEQVLQYDQVLVLRLLA